MTKANWIATVRIPLMVAAGCLIVTATLAGCIGDGIDDNLQEGTSDTQAPRWVETQIDETDTLGVTAGICHNTLVTLCYFGNTPSDVMFEFTPEGTFQNASLELGWDAESVFMENLLFALLWDCDDGCEREVVRGNSPLQIAVEDLDVNGTVIVWVAHDRYCYQSNDCAYVSQEQDFQVEGTLTSLMVEKEVME